MGYNNRALRVVQTQQRPHQIPTFLRGTAMTTLDVSTSRHVCPKCQQEKPLTREFWCLELRANRNPWVTYACRLCRNAAMRKWKASNPEKRREERRKYSEKQGKQYFPRGERCISTKFIEKEYDKIIESNARDAFNWWFAKKSDGQVAAWCAATGKPWNNPRLTRAEAFRIRYRLDSEFNTYQRMRRQLKKFLYNDGVTELIRYGLNNNTESTRAEELLGYTIGELRMHIERQFTKGMNWNKFMKGEIHIDHIHPKASFDLSDQEQWRICWSLPNLRPLWAKENRVKSAKVMTLL